MQKAGLHLLEKSILREVIPKKPGASDLNIGPKKDGGGSEDMV